MTPHRLHIAVLGGAIALATLASTGPVLAAGPPAFPATIHGQHMSNAHEPNTLARGTSVAAADVTQRVSLGGQVRAGLGDRGKLEGSVYPVLSTDGGRHWHIDGPLFYRAAAQAPNVTSRLAALGHRTLIAWGKGGNFVKATSDRGRNWYVAQFTVGVYSAGAHAGHLVVRALGNPNRAGRFPTRRYISSDGGKVWQRGAALASVRL